MKYVVKALHGIVCCTLLGCAVGTRPAASNSLEDGQSRSLIGDGGIFYPLEMGAPPDSTSTQNNTPKAAPDQGKAPDAKPATPDQGPPKPDLPKPDLPKPPLKKDSGALPPKVIYHADFEKNNGSLKAWGDWQWGQLAFKPGPNCDSPSTMAPPPKAYGGKGLWGTRLNDCHSPANNTSSGCKNSNPKDDSILRLGVMLPKGYKKATMTYMEWADFFKDFDWAELRINNKVALQNCSGGHKKPTAWVKRTVDLTPYIGQWVGIEFHFMASSVVNLSGWYIDQLTIKAQ